MKPDLDTIRSISNFGGETQVMTLDENALHHLMTVMTDLYSDPQRAVIREYCTNALDAIIAAGSSEPILVTLPSSANPNFIVQDTGTGLTTDEVLHVYSQYGNSTKRDSNDVVGMLGLGCKSGLTYASSFVIRTVRNGIETVANVTKNAEGVGEIQIIDTRKTDARNGTTITIPVGKYDIASFIEKAEQFFYYWQPGTVLVNGKAPTFFVNDFDKAGWIKVNGRDDTYYSKGFSYYPESLVVMGNVAYPVTRDEWKNPLSDGRNQHHAIIHFAPIGAVNFAPSREELSYRGKTKDYLANSLHKILVEEINYVMNSKLAEAKTSHEAFAIANELRNLSFIGNTRSVTWNGQKVPTYNEALGVSNNRIVGRNIYSWQTRTNWNGNNHRIDRNPWFGIGNREMVFIANAPENLSAAHKYGLRDAFGTSATIFCWTDGKNLDNEWVKVLDWNTLKKTLAKPASSGISNSNSGPVDRVGRNGATLDSDGYYTGDYFADLDKDQKVYAFTPTNRPDKHVFGNIVRAGVTPVSVYKADFDKFVSDNAGRVFTTMDQVNDYAKEAANKFTDEEWNYIVLNGQAPTLLNALVKSLDVESAAMVQLSESGEKVLARVSVLDYRHTYENRQKADKRIAKIVNLYPLATGYGASERAVLEYINALYTTRKGQ